MPANRGKKNKRRKRISEVRIRTKKTDLMRRSAATAYNFFQKNWIEYRSQSWECSAKGSKGWSR